jgi:hypothetical protein
MLWNRCRRGAGLLVGLVASAALLAGCGEEDSIGLAVTGSTPADASTAVDLSLSVMTVSFNHPVATTYDPDLFAWPHLDFVRRFMALEDPIGQVPIPYFLDYDPQANALVLYLSEPPTAGDAYRLTLAAGLSSEEGLTLLATKVIAFSLGQPSFGGGVFANRVIEYLPELPTGESTGSGFYNPASALGAPKGPLHVVSLGDDRSAAGGLLTLGFGDGLPGAPGASPYCIADETGPDFRIHENVFLFNDGSGPVNFTEAAYVEVSQNGTDFFRFTVTAPTSAAAVGDPASYAGLTGIREGGDDFDLASLEQASGFQACYVRIVDGGAEVMDYDWDGAWGTQSPSGADIDAVEVLHAVESPGLSP